MAVNVDTAFNFYLERFRRTFGSIDSRTTVKFHEQPIRLLAREEFEACLARYLDVHAACKSMIDSGATMNDAVITELREVAAWIALDPPDMLAMFRGELGDPNDAVTRADVEIDDA